MINVIFPIDPSTEFLYNIINNLRMNGVECNVIEIHPNDDSYSNSKILVENLQNKWDVIFLGHGKSNQLYGGESEDYEKKVFINNKEMSIFSGRNLFALACDSSILLKETFLHSGIIKSIGFGALPTNKKEVENNKRLSKAGINDAVIDSFKEVLVKTTSLAFGEYLINKKDYIFLYNYLCLLINKEINDSVLIRKDRILADLIYKMRVEMRLF